VKSAKSLVAALAAAALIATPSLARAQGPLAKGDTVRLWSGAGRHVGTVAMLSDDSLALAGPRGDIAMFARGQIRRVQRAAGRSSRGAAILRGAGVGLLAGTGVGILSGVRVSRITCNPGDFMCQPGQKHDHTIGPALIAEGGFLGAICGAMLGPVFRHQRWLPVDAPAPVTATTSAAAGGKGGGVTVSIHLRI
jgi:hypothetical protein